MKRPLLPSILTQFVLNPTYSPRIVKPIGSPPFQRQNLSCNFVTRATMMEESGTLESQLESIKQMSEEVKTKKVKK